MLNASAAMAPIFNPLSLEALFTFAWIGLSNSTVAVFFTYPSYDAPLNAVKEILVILLLTAPPLPL